MITHMKLICVAQSFGINIQPLLYEAKNTCNVKITLDTFISTGEDKHKPGLMDQLLIKLTRDIH